jgi:hypothetical protein
MSTLDWALMCEVSNAEHTHLEYDSREGDLLETLASREAVLV